MEVLKIIKDKDVVVVSANKTITFKTIGVDNYKTQVLDHLHESATEIPRAQLQNKFNEAKKLLHIHEDILSDDEYNYIDEKINSRAIATPKLLIKDHKKQKENGTYPTRLICPADNFIAAFPNIGYRGIRNILNKHNINYSKKTIIQAVDVKNKLEKLNIK